jgi:hypothetical protein
MNLKKLAAQAGIAGALGFGALGLGTGLAHAEPPVPPQPPAPVVPGNPAPPGLNYMQPPGHGGPMPDRDDIRGPVPADPDDFHRGPVPTDRDDTHGMWHNAPWGGQAPPWGWGRPPRPDFDDSRLPPPGAPWNAGPINYWGYQANPVWDPGFNQWGFWLFGVWIPL